MTITATKLGPIGMMNARYDFERARKVEQAKNTAEYALKAGAAGAAGGLAGVAIMTNENKAANVYDKIKNVTKKLFNKWNPKTEFGKIFKEGNKEFLQKISSKIKNPKTKAIALTVALVTLPLIRIGNKLSQEEQYNKGRIDQKYDTLKTLG